MHSISYSTNSSKSTSSSILCHSQEKFYTTGGSQYETTFRHPSASYLSYLSIDAAPQLCSFPLSTSLTWISSCQLLYPIIIRCTLTHSLYSCPDWRRVSLTSRINLTLDTPSPLCHVRRPSQSASVACVKCVGVRYLIRRRRRRKKELGWSNRCTKVEECAPLVQAAEAWT